MRDLCHVGDYFAPQFNEETRREDRSRNPPKHHREKTPDTPSDKFQIRRLVSKGSAVDQHQREVSTGGLIRRGGRTPAQWNAPTPL
jgi:hypothetical protein